MLVIRQKHLRSLILAAGCALAPLTAAWSYDLLASDMAAYRADVVRRVFDAVKNSPAYARVIIELHITALGKIKSCKVIKGSGNSELDASMMKALSEVDLKPMKFASSANDTVEIQIYFGNPVPDSNNLYLRPDEAFTFRSFGTFMQVAGPNSKSSPGAEKSDRSVRPEAARTMPAQIGAQAPFQQSEPDRLYDEEIRKLLADSPPELTFDTLQYGLNQVPDSAAQLKKADSLINDKRYLAAAHAYMLALPEQFKKGDSEAVKTLLSSLSKLVPQLQGNERFNIGMSLVNFCDRIGSRMPIGPANSKVNSAVSINAILSTAQQFVDQSSSKRLGRLAYYYQKKGKALQEIGNVDKAKLAYQRCLSIMLENEDALPADVEQAFDSTVTFLASQEDWTALSQVENQRSVWQTKHPDPTNLFAINSLGKQLELALNKPEGSAADSLVERLLILIRTSSLNKQDASDRFSLLTEQSGPFASRNDIQNRVFQELDRVSRILEHRDSVSASAEPLLREIFKFAICTNSNLQQRLFQTLGDYLVAKGKAQEALLLCDLVDNLDTEDYLLLQRARANPQQQLRLKALKALGRTEEADQLQTQIKDQMQSLITANIDRNIAVAESRLAKAPPYSAERIQARTLLVTSLLSQKQPDMQKVRSIFMESLQELASEKFTSASMSEYWDLSNQLISILNKAEPDLEFTTNAVEGLLRIQYKRTAHSRLSASQLSRAMPLTTILDNASLKKHPQVHLALIGNLIKFCDKQPLDDDTNKRILLRQQAVLQNKMGDTRGATKSNLELLALLEQQKIVSKSELVNQLLELARAEAASNDTVQARRHEKRAAQLGFESVDTVVTRRSLVELSKSYAAGGALKEASDALLEAVKLPQSASSAPQHVSTSELVRACEKAQQFAIAGEFFKGAIEFEKAQVRQSTTVLNLYRMEYSNLLLTEAFSGRSEQTKDSLLKQSEQLFTEAADDLIHNEGPDSKTLGGEVRRRAFVFSLNNMSEQSENLMERYKTAVANAAGGTLKIDVNVGAPPKETSDQR
ncbi:MAG: TonB family protein [Cyanobacteria bacterium SZAS LIN-5]|nr:TonB family protein [Cyanobacteria bacterium SZAS LIN-5]